MKKGFIETSLVKPTSTTQSLGPLLQTTWVAVTVNGAKLHFAEKQMKLSENKENGKPLLAARTTARRKGNRDMEKRILKAKSPGKKLREDSFIDFVRRNVSGTFRGGVVV